MKDIHLRPHQIKAVEAIQQALKNHQKHMVVEMPVGCGKGIVLVKTVEILRKQGVDKILVITGSLNVKEQISHSLYRDYEGPFQIDKYNTIVKTEQWLYRHLSEIKNEFQFIVFFDAGTQKTVQELLNNNENKILYLQPIISNIHAGCLLQRKLYFHIIIRKLLMMESLPLQWIARHWGQQ